MDRSQVVSEQGQSLAVTKQTTDQRTPLWSKLRFFPSLSFIREIQNLLPSFSVPSPSAFPLLLLPRTSRGIYKTSPRIKSNQLKYQLNSRSRPARSQDVWEEKVKIYSADGDWERRGRGRTVETASVLVAGDHDWIACITSCCCSCPNCPITACNSALPNTRAPSGAQHLQGQFGRRRTRTTRRRRLG